MVRSMILTVVTKGIYLRKPPLVGVMHSPLMNNFIKRSQHVKNPATFAARFLKYVGSA